MTPFERASYPPEAFDYHRYTAAGMTKAQAKQVVAEIKAATVWKNDKYQVAIRVMDNGDIRHLSIKRNDREPIHDWRDLQEIKNMLCGEDSEAVELYPAEARRVDTANQYHLWVFPRGQRIPIGFPERLVWDADEGLPIPGAKQRPFTTTETQS